MVKGKKHEDVSVDRPDDTATDPLTQSASGSPEGRARDYEGQERRGDERRLQDRRTAERRASGEAAENPEKSALNENLRLKEAEVSKLQAELASLRDLSQEAGGVRQLQEENDQAAGGQQEVRHQGHGPGYHQRK